MHEKCGVVGVKDLRGERNVVPWAAEIACNLKHRGQLGAGIAGVRTDAQRALWTVKDNGPVETVLAPEKLQHCESTAAIAHTRYATSGSRDACLAQPFVGDGIAYAFNGTIANHASVEASQRARGVTLCTDVDTELVGNEMVGGIRKYSREDMGAVFRALESVLDGSFNVVALGEEGDLYAYRNALGNRPMSYAVIDDRYVAAASEDHAILEAFPWAAPQTLEPGQLLIARGGNWEIQDVLRDAPQARCFLEWTYFADYRSTLDGQPVGAARYAFGQYLGKAETLHLPDAVVVPVPDSSRPHAEGYASVRHLPIVPAIGVKIPGRTFIEGDEQSRIKKAQEKYTIDPQLIRGKKIILVDDSLVRGTTLKALVKRLREEGGVSEIHVRLACPPILAPCFYGIDFPEIKKLLARLNFSGVLTAEELPEEVLALIAARLGVDSIRFLPVEAVPQVLARQCHGLCMACVNGEYPTPAGRMLYAIEERKARSPQPTVPAGLS